MSGKYSFTGDVTITTPVSTHDCNEHELQAALDMVLKYHLTGDTGDVPYKHFSTIANVLRSEIEKLR